jgi:hypothetical protein
VEKLTPLLVIYSIWFRRHCAIAFLIYWKLHSVLSRLPDCFFGWQCSAELVRNHDESGKGNGGLLIPHASSDESKVRGNWHTLSA